MPLLLPDILRHYAAAAAYFLYAAADAICYAMLCFSLMSFLRHDCRHAIHVVAVACHADFFRFRCRFDDAAAMPRFSFCYADAAVPPLASYAPALR